LSNRYRFDLESRRDTILDEAGVEADSLQQAIDQAVAVIEEMRVSGELEGSNEGWNLVIRDDAGAELKRIPL
jgi:hypothetical protein